VFGWAKQPPKALTMPDTEECSFLFGDGPLDEDSPVDLLDLLEDSEEFASLFFDFHRNNFTPSWNADGMLVMHLRKISLFVSMMNSTSLLRHCYDFHMPRPS
jgi:hypothetical protein